MGAPAVKVADFVVLNCRRSITQGLLALGFLFLASAHSLLVLAASSSSSEGSRRTTARRVLSG